MRRRDPELRHDFAPIEIGEYRATWRPLIHATMFGVGVDSRYVVQKGDAFVGIAETPEQVAALVATAERRPAA